MKRTYSILVSLLLVFGILSMFNNKDLYNSQDKNSTENKIISKSDFWDLTSAPIFINDTDPAKDWNYHATNEDWCTGTGVWGDPYVLENITIDGQGTNICIEIRNSKAYFIIRNCTVYGADGTLERGILLDNVSNGIIKNNTINGNHYGLVIYGSNNTILDNYAYSNSMTGITINGENNTLEYNTIFNNGGSGITISQSDNNTLINNTLINDRIYIYKGNNNTLINNTVDQSYYGITIQESDYNRVLNNTFTKVQWAVYISGYYNIIKYNKMRVYIDCIRYFGLYGSNTIEENDCSKIPQDESDDDDDSTDSNDEFDLTEFLMSPVGLGLMIIGAGSVALIILILKKNKER